MMKRKAKWKLFRRPRQSPTSCSALNVERSKHIPLRLLLVERKHLQLLDATLQVSEFTDKIDTLGFGLSMAKRVVHQIHELCAILSGLVLAADYTDYEFASNADFYQKVFELCRRHLPCHSYEKKTCSR